jgi:hypothetical protein
MLYESLAQIRSKRCRLSRKCGADCEHGRCGNRESTSMHRGPLSSVRRDDRRQFRKCRVRRNDRRQFRERRMRRNDRRQFECHKSGTGNCTTGDQSD